MAWAQDSELLAAYALAGGLATPLLLSTGGNHELFLFTYLLAIDIATVVLIRLKPWPRLLLGAFPATIVYFIGWYVQFYAREDLLVTSVFIVLFFTVFASVSIGSAIATGRQLSPFVEGDHRRDTSAIGQRRLRLVGPLLCASGFRPSRLPALAHGHPCSGISGPDASTAERDFGGDPSLARRRVPHHRHSAEGERPLDHRSVVRRRRSLAVGRRPHYCQALQQKSSLASSAAYFDGLLQERSCSDFAVCSACPSGSTRRCSDPSSMPTLPRH